MFKSVLGVTLSVLLLVGLMSSGVVAESADSLVSQERTYFWMAKQPHKDYPDSANNTKLTDGIIGSTDFKDGLWVGIWDTAAVSIMLDLGETTSISSVKAHLLSGGAGIKFPQRMSVSISADGVKWTPAGEVEAPEYIAGKYVTEWVTLKTDFATARFVQLDLKPLAGGHFLFISEVEVYE